MSFRNRDNGRVQDPGSGIQRYHSRRARSRRARRARRGVLLLVVLSLLVLFMLIGTAFLMSSNQYKTSATASARLNRVGNPPTKLLDRALIQVLCDTGNPSSVIRFHSLLRDMYGTAGFEAMVFSPIDGDLNASFPSGNLDCQITRFATPTTGTPAPATSPLGPTQGQLIDIYVREHAFQRDDRLIFGSETQPTVPDARNIIKLERSVLGLPEMYNMPLTKGYFNGCTLTITSGPARGQSTRIVDFDYIGDFPTNQNASSAPPPFPSKIQTRLFRFRVLAFPNANGEPLRTRNQLPTNDTRYSNHPARGLEIADLVAAEEHNNANSIVGTTGATFIVNGRPFSGTGAGFNQLAKAGDPRLNVVETVGFGADATKWLYPEVALAPNSRYFFAADPANPTSATDDVWGARYYNPAAATYQPLNPTSTNPTAGGVPVAPINLRPLLWKYQNFAGPGDAHESYDAPDFQNMALAMQTVTPRAIGRVVQGATPLNPTYLDADDPTIRSNLFLRLDLEDLPIPSFHRPDLENYWFHRLMNFAITADGASPDDAARAVIAPYGANKIRGDGDDPSVTLNIRDQIVALKRKISLRPLAEDHPGFNGSNPASQPPDLRNVSGPLTRGGNIAIPFWEAVGPWDVDNDGDGIPDSVWVDLGDPVQQAEDGTLYKPMYAFLIVDLDSRLNLNAHGLVEHFRTPSFSTIPNPNFDPTSPAGPANPKRIPARNLANDLNLAGGLYSSDFLPSGSGYGPAEISLRPLFSQNLPGNANTTLSSRIGNPAFDDYARLLVGRARVGDQPSVWGRHGSVNVRGIATTDWSDNAAAATQTLRVRPGIPYNGAILPGAIDPNFADRLALFKFFGYPVWPSDAHGDKMQAPLPTVRTAFSSPPDLQGRFAVGLDYQGQPIDEVASDAYLNINSQSLLVDTPYELDLSNPRRRDTPDAAVAATIINSPLRQAALNDDAPFATADLERILRAHDADSGILPDRLWTLVDAFDPLKLTANQFPLVQAAALRTFGTNSPTDAQAVAAAQQIAAVNRRLVTTDSYDVPTPANNFLKRLIYGADGQPGRAGIDDDGSNGADDPGELGWQNSDDWYAVMYRGLAGHFNASGAPTPPPGIRIEPQNPTIVDLLKYRIQFERWKKNPALPIYNEVQLNQIVSELLAPEVLAGGKMDLNRPFGDGRDNGDGIDNDGDGAIDETNVDNNGDGIVDEPLEVGDPYLNGIVDDPLEAGEPFLDLNGNGKWDSGERWIDVNADGQYNPPLDRLWTGVTAEPITFDYTQGHGEPIHPQAANPPAIPLTAKVRNLNSQGRQLFARHLYCLAMLLTDENYLEMPDLPALDGNNLNLELLLMKIAVDNGGSAFAATTNDMLLLRRKQTAQRVAQWAVNCADFRDADSIMTPFEYDEYPWDGWGCLDANGVNIPLDGDVSTDENFGQIIDWRNVTPASGASNPPSKPIVAVSAPPVVADRTRGVVWGAERPELLITETLAFHDRRCTDEIDYGQVSVPPPANAKPEDRDYDLDQRLKPRGSVFVELYNPWSADGQRPAELYGNVPGSGITDHGVMLNRLSDRVDPVSNKYSPVWRMSVLREPLNGRMPVFKNLNKKLDSGVIDLTTGFPVPIASDQESLSADFLTIDPDGYNLNMDEAAERHVYFTTGRNYATGVGSDANRSDDDNTEYEPSNPLSLGDWQYKDASNVPLNFPRPVVNQLHVRVPPLPQRRAVSISGTTHYVPIAKRYFIARTERIDDPSVGPEPNDVDVTIAPILPGRYAVVGSSGLQLQGFGPGTAPTPDGQTTQRFVTPISRDASQQEDANGDRETLGSPTNPGRLPGMRRIELWPNAAGRPDIHQVLVAENGGHEFVRINNSTVVNATDPEHDGNPTNSPANRMLIDPAVAIPVEDLSVSEPVEGYPSIANRRLIEINNPLTSTGLLLGFPEPNTNPRLSPGGVLVYPKPYEVSPDTGECYYTTPYDRPLDTDFELVRNGTTQNYRSIHLQRLANPTLPWNPAPFDAAGNLNPLHRSWLPVNPYRTIDSQSVDLTAYNGASTRERTDLPASHTSFSQDLTTDKLQANVLAPITATQFLDAPDHEIWAMILLMKLKGISIGNSPEELRGAATTNIDAVESPLSQLEALEPDTRAELTSTLQETAVLQPKFRDGMQQGWNWHMYRRVLPDDMLSGASLTGFRQWLHFKSLERGHHASNYFKYPKPGAFYSSNPQSLEGWAPDLSVVPRTLWKQERPNARLFLQGPTGIVDASDLETVTSWRVLSGKTPVDPTELAQHQQRTPDSNASRNQLIWSQLAASTTAGTEPGAVFDYVLEQTLGFANRSYTPDLERADGEITSAMISYPRPGAPEVATNSNRRPANPLTYGTTPEKEIWNYQRQAAKLQTAPNPPVPQPSLLQAVVNDGSLTALQNQLVDEFYERRRILTGSTFPWMTWNNRPLVSADEIMQVPAASSSLMLRGFAVPNLFTANPFDGNPMSGANPKTIAQQAAMQAAPFGHLLNFFASNLLPAVNITDPRMPTGAANFQRLFNFVEVPSRYIGTDTLLSPEVFNDVPSYVAATEPVGTDITSLDDPRLLFQPPFNKVSRQRDPGRVNLNTVTGRRRVESNGFIRHWSEVYDGIMHRYGDGNLLDSANNVLQLSHFGPAWRDVALSRKGYAQFNADDPNAPVEKVADTQVEPDTFAFGLNHNFPSIFSNPFRSADAGDLVPLANMVRPGVEATTLRGIHWQRAYEPPPTNDDVLLTNPYSPRTAQYDHIAWGVAGVDDDGNGLVDDIREAGYGVITDPPTVDGDTLRIRPSLNGALEGSGIPLFSEQVPVPAIDGQRNPGMMYQPMTRLGNLVTNRSNVYAIWITVGYFEVERAPDWIANEGNIRQRFGATTNDTDAATVRGRALYDRVYPEGYTLGEELGTDTGNTNRQRAFYIIDRTEPVGFKPGEDLNVDKMIRVRRRIE